MNLSGRYRCWSSLSLTSALLAIACLGCAESETPVKSPSASAEQEDVAGADSPSTEVSSGGEANSTVANKSAATKGDNSAVEQSELATKHHEMNSSAKKSYVEGVALFKQGDLAGAEASLLKAVTADPQSAEAFFTAGLILERQGKAGQAISAYKKAMATGELIDESAFAAISLLVRDKKMSEAEQLASSFLNSYPDSAGVLSGVAEIKSAEQNSGAAQKYIQSALKKRPDFKPAMFLVARDYFRTRRYDLALYSLQGLLDGFGPENPPRDSKNGEAFLLRAKIYIQQDKRRLALLDLQKATELRPDIVEGGVLYAGLLLESGNANQAVTALQMAIRFQPNHVLAHLNLGDAFRLQGKTSDALKELNWVQSKEPNLAAVYYNLALVYLLSKEIPNMAASDAVDKAIANLQKVKELSSGSRSSSLNDVDDLLARANNRKVMLAAMQQTAAVPNGGAQ